MVLPPFLGQMADASDKSPAVAAISVVGLLASIITISIVTALVVGRFIRIVLRGGHVSTSTRLSGHAVVCGWNTQGDTIVNSLLAVGAPGGIAIVAPLDRRPTDRVEVEFVSGDPTQDDALRRAGIDRARNALVLTDFRANANDADAKSLLIALAIEALAPKVHTCVQVHNSTNRRHFERAGVNEIICLDTIGGCLAVASTANYGASVVLKELLTANVGCDFHMMDGRSASRLVGLTFVEAAKTLAERHVILLGVETDAAQLDLQMTRDQVTHAVGGADDRILVLNPATPYHIRSGDKLLCIAHCSQDMSCE